MTYIEFYDPSQPENICSSLVSKPDRIVFFCDNTKQFKRLCERMGTIFQDRGWDIELKCKTARQNDVQKLADLISIVVDEYGDCVIDLTGGSDLLLCAAGIVQERYKGSNLQFHRINFNNGVITDCDGDGKVISGNPIELSVKENVILYGGSVKKISASAKNVRGHSSAGKFAAQAKAAWEISRQNSTLWNMIASLLAYITRNGETDSSGVYFGMRRDLISQALPVIPDNEDITRLFSQMKNRGLLSDFYIDSDYLSVTYESERVIGLLVESGKVLEMDVFFQVLGAYEDDGTPSYNDACTGVVISWETDVETAGAVETVETVNEIDVLMMHGVTPVFVSCKNGSFKVDELYKLDAVARRFGLQHSKRVLVTTSRYSDEFRQVLMQRAADMNIRLVENYQYLSDAEKNRVIRSFWK